MSIQKPNPNHETGYFGNPRATMTDRVLWVWKNNRLKVEQGKNHSQGMAWENADVEQYFRGWYDPSTQDLFLIGPKAGVSDGGKPLRSIPRLLDRVLRRRFGEFIKYRAF